MRWFKPVCKKLWLEFRKHKWLVLYLQCVVAAKPKKTAELRFLERMQVDGRRSSEESCRTDVKTGGICI